MNHTLTSKPFLIKSIGIAVTLILIYLAVSTVAIASAQESLSQYMPTAADLNTIRPGWTIESDLLIDEQSTPYPFIHKSFSLNMQWVSGEWSDQITIDISMHSFPSPDDVPKNHEQILTKTEPCQTITSKGALTIGDSSFYTISYCSASRWKGIALIFTEGKYYVLIDVIGSSEDGLYEGQTTASVPTLADAETLANIIEAKLPATITQWPTSISSAGGSFVENHPIVSITGIAVGGIVAGFAVAGATLVASCVAEAGLMVGTTGVAEALISLPLVGGLFSRIILSPWAMQMVGLYGQYVDDFVLWTTAMVDKVPAAINAVNHYFSEPKPQPRLPDWLRRHRP